MKKLGKITTGSLSKSLKGGYGEIGRRYGLDWIEP